MQRFGKAADGCRDSARALIAQQADVIYSLYQDTPSVVTVAEEEEVFVKTFELWQGPRFIGDLEEISTVVKNYDPSNDFLQLFLQ